jgi:hypothetical protein
VSGVVSVGAGLGAGTSAGGLSQAASVISSSVTAAERSAWSKRLFMASPFVLITAK